MRTRTTWTETKPGKWQSVTVEHSPWSRRVILGPVVPTCLARKLSRGTVPFCPRVATVTPAARAF